MASKRIFIGVLVKIDLDDGVFGYGQVVSESEIAFFDCVGPPLELPDVEQIYFRSVIFVVAVANSAIKSGRWPVVDKGILSDELKKPRKYAMQDRFSKKISVYKSDTGEIVDATWADIDGLESAAVWGPEHVEDRLRDHYMGRPNVWVEQLKRTRPA